MDPTWIIKLCGGLRGFVLACAACVLLLAVGVQTHRLGNAQSARDEALVDVGKWREINATNYDNLMTALATNELWARGSKAAKARQAQAIQDAEARGKRLARVQTTTRRDRDKLYEENTDARQWADTPVPAVLYDSLLDEWQQYEDANR